jgi:Icc-related predicted phosphoesterase
MSTCFFASDLHGHVARYECLFERIAAERPAAVFLGGDLLTGGSDGDILEGYLRPQLGALRDELGAAYPRIFTILGNDDPRDVEPAVCALAAEGYWEYAHERRIAFGTFDVFGYSFIPPTPFRLKDWERYDVSRFVDPGCISPEEGVRTVPQDAGVSRHATIADDLQRLTEGCDLSRAILLFHAPPHGTYLDRAALDGRSFDHAPLDVHVGSIAIRRLIEARQPLLTLHGHIHESARITGAWRQHIGETPCLSAAHDGPELALVRFDPARPEAATRELL